MAAHSEASSDSSARGGASLRRRRRPIPYHQLPFNYAPAKYCDCGEMMPQWISWSDDNTCRRYHNCRIRSIEGGVWCGRFSWVDGEMPKYQRDLIKDLRDAVWEKTEEIERLEAELLHVRQKNKNEETVEKMQASDIYIYREKLQMQANELEQLKKQGDGEGNFFMI
uniref:Uncharacterized protein n=1 Tax=Avena sativa TaxID=4498 RepID=A0ACD5U971_AVESA